MQYRYLGNSGLKVSALSFGAWVTFGDQIGEDVATELMKTAYDHGVNFFDNAEGYSSGKAETMMGNVIKKQGWKRSDLVVSTKIFWGGGGPNDMGLSRKHIIEGTKAAIERFQMDYVDLVFCHRPDPNTPIEETGPGDELSFRSGISVLLGDERVVGRADSPSVRSCAS